MDKNSGTRSGLLWQVERILEECKELGAMPKILLMENVPDLVGVKHINNFKKWRLKLEELGYSNYDALLNAKDFGIPQNRKRCFMVSILGNYNYKIPSTIPLEIRLKNVLEDEVDEKYYLSKFLNPRFTENYIQYDNSGKGYNSQATRLYYQDGLCPTLPSSNGGDKSQVILLDKKDVKSLFTEIQAQMITPDGNVKRYISSDIVDEFNESQMADISFPNGYGKGKRTSDVCPTLTTTSSSNFIYKQSQVPLIIRKLTPKECFKLMGLRNEDIANITKNQSDSSLYHLAGDSIVTSVLCALFGNLFGIDYKIKIKELINDLTEVK